MNLVKLCLEILEVSTNKTGKHTCANVLKGTPPISEDYFSLRNCFLIGFVDCNDICQRLLKCVKFNGLFAVLVLDCRQNFKTMFYLKVTVVLFRGYGCYELAGKSAIAGFFLLGIAYTMSLSLQLSRKRVSLFVCFLVF